MIQLQCRETDPGAIKLSVPHLSDDPIYVRKTHAGRVLETYERNGYDDSDFYAVVFDEDNCGFSHVEYATTRGWTYANGATVDYEKKIVRAKVTYADIAGLDGSAGSSGISGALLNQLAQMDGYIHVVRDFMNDSVPHISGSIDPLRDIQVMDAEFILSDLIMVERKLERLVEEHRRGVSRDRAVIEVEIELFERLKATLGNESPLRNFDFSAEDDKILSSYGFLSRKPQIIVFNQTEDQAPREFVPTHKHTLAISMPAKLVMDIAALPPEDAALFMAEYGIEEPGLDRLIRLSYELLGLQSFFTAGEQEVRAWTVRVGAKAPESAGVIHTDFERGFIKAEVISYADYDAFGSEASAKAAGKLRIEGKEYVVADGDVMHFRFNV